MEACRLSYELLSHEEKIAYNKFLDAFMSFSDVVDASGIKNGIDLMKVLNCVIGDNPRIIHFNKSQIKLSSSVFGGKQIKLCGTYTKKQIQQMYETLDNKVDLIIEEISQLNPITTYDKLICIYEYFQDNIVYDSKELDNVCCRGNVSNPMSHNAYGALVNGKAVCDGITAAFSLIAQKMNIESTMLAGKATFRTTGFSNHAWNVIRLDNKCYHIDATWDINRKCETGVYSYDYLCADDDMVSTNHDWDVKTMHLCNYSDLSFYVRNNCLANNLSQLEEIFVRFAKSKLGVVRARVKDGIPIPEPETEQLGQILAKAAGIAGRYNPFEYYWDKNTRCFFAQFK